MAESFAERLKKWRGKLYQKQAAAVLDISVWTFRNWEWGRRTPRPLTMIEVERRMEKHECSR
jgi:DNA-binding transcriptional regulator YiaG